MYASVPGPVDYNRAGPTISVTITERSTGGVQLLDVGGPITLGDGADQLRDRIRRLAQQGHRKLVINLEHVPYLDSAGLGELVHAHSVMAKQEGGGLRLLNATKRLRDHLVMTRLLDVLETFDDEAAAVASFGKTV